METALNPAPAAKALFESLCQLGSAHASAWLDCATRLEIAASSAPFASQKRELRARADEARTKARRAALPVIDISIERCAGCDRPAHASETDDQGYHPACRAA